MADPKAVVEIANELFAAGKYEAALASYDEALTLVSSAPELHCNRGAALRNLGRVEEALAALDEALAARPDFAEAHNNKGLTLLLSDRKEDALASFMAAVDSNPQFMQGYFGATQVLNQLGRHEEAAGLLQRAIEVEPSAQLYGEMAFTLLRLGDCTRAVTVAEQALELAGSASSLRMKQTYAVALSTLASQKVQAGQLADAIALYTKALGVEESEGRLFNRAVCYVQSDMTAEAKADLLRVTTLNAGNEKAHTLLASLFMVSSEWEPSAQHFGAAVKLNPAALDASLLYNFGFVLLKLDKPEAAAEQFRKALAKNPGMTAAQSALELIASRDGVEESGSGEEAKDEHADSAQVAATAAAPATQEPVVAEKVASVPQAEASEPVPEAAPEVVAEEEPVPEPAPAPAPQPEQPAVIAEVPAEAVAEGGGVEYSEPAAVVDAQPDDNTADHAVESQAPVAAIEYNADASSYQDGHEPSVSASTAAPAPAPAPRTRARHAAAAVPMFAPEPTITEESGTAAGGGDDDDGLTEEERAALANMGKVQRLAMKFQKQADKSARRPSFFK